MQSAPKPANESERLRALRRLHILDTGPEAEFEALVAMAASALHAPIALISLVDDERQWFKARIGLDATETARAVSFCGHAILRGDPLIVNDAAQDARFADNPLVTGAPHIRAYLGAPLALSDGAAIGTVCVCALEPTEWTPSDAERITELARLAAAAIERRSEKLHAKGLRVCTGCLDVLAPSDEGANGWTPIEDFLARGGGWSGSLENGVCPACAAMAVEVA